MTKVEKQTAQEVDLPGGEDTEESLPLFPNPTAGSAQEGIEIDWIKFDWLNDPSVIVRDQAGVCAYFNRFGELVIKQRDTLGESATLYIAPENVSKVLSGLRDRAKQGGE
jgi:hypothetical protein